MRKIRMQLFLIITSMLVVVFMSASAVEATTTGKLTAFDRSKMYFGSYPQREVVSVASQSGVYGKTWGSTSEETNDCYIVNSELYTILKNLSDDKWDANGDTTLEDGTKYRRLSKSNGPTYSTSGSSDHYDWSDSTTYHYFKYEPIKWRVLQKTENDAFLFCDMAIDDQCYSLYNDDMTWEKSTVRSWLNCYGSSSNKCGKNYSGIGFYDIAFDATEKGVIKTTNVINDNNILIGTDGGNDTQDKIFLLSEDEVYGSKAEDYGFAEGDYIYDTARQMKCTTYAVAMGTYIEINSISAGCCQWWLRSPGFPSGCAVGITSLGDCINNGYSIASGYNGILPALHINLTSINPSWAEKSVDDITLSSYIMLYTGEELKPSVTIEGLTDGTDFDVTYANNTDVGTAKVIVTGKGEWSNTITKTFEIKYDINEVDFSLSQDSYTYNGKECEPEIVSNLILGTDFDVEYSNNINVGTALVTITGKGNYSGTATREFAINKTDATGITIELDQTEYTYDGEEKKPGVTVYDADDNEIASSNYEVSYDNNIDAGEAIVTVSLNDDYYDGQLTLVANFTILKAQHTLNIEQDELKVIVGKTAQINATGSGNISYTIGNKKIAAISSTGLVKGVKAGTTHASLEIAGDDNHVGVTKTIDVIVPTVITKAVLNKTSYTYNGDVQKPGIKSVNGSTKLIKDVDYTVTYKDSTGEECDQPKDAGTYKVVITGINKYDGTVTLNYTIAQATKTITATASSTTAYISKASPTITATVSDGADITYSLDKTSKKYVSIVDDGEGNATITPIKAGTATVTISAKASTNYKATSKTVKVTVKDPVNINSTKVTTIGKAVWNGGEAVHPTVTVKSGKTTYKKDTDYTIDYKVVDADGNETGDWEVGNYVVVTVDASSTDMLACKGKYTSKPIEIVRATQSATATAPSTIYYGEGKEPVQIDVDNIPSTEGDTNPTIKYESSKTKIATVSDDGKITPIKAGKVTITVNIGETTHYSAKSIKLTVNVKAATKLTSKNVKITAAYNDGENVIPTVTVTGFKKDIDYIVDYDNSGINDIGHKITVTVTAVTESGGCLGTYEKEVVVGKGEQSITIDNQPTTVKVKSTTPTFTIVGVKDNADVDVTTTKTYAKIEKLGIDQEGNYQFAIKGFKKGTATVTVKIGATSKYNAKTLTFKVKVTK